MRLLHILLLPLCLLFAQVASGVGLLAMFHVSPEYRCAKRGGTCNFSPCPMNTHVEGHCYQGKASCCL